MDNSTLTKWEQTCKKEIETFIECHPKTYNEIVIHIYEDGVSYNIWVCDYNLNDAISVGSSCIPNCLEDCKNILRKYNLFYCRETKVKTSVWEYDYLDDKE